MSFRCPKRRMLKTSRFARDSDSDEEKDEAFLKTKSEHPVPIHDVVENVKLWQNTRKRHAGVSAESLFVGHKVEEEAVLEADPFKLKTGGLVNMKGSFRNPSTDNCEDEVRLSHIFAAETNKRDEDADLLKYIEDEMAKRKGIVKATKDTTKSDVDTLLAEIPDELKPEIGQQSEDMLSNQVLCGIPEVDLGVESKMRNIEATEEAKQQLLKARFSRRQLNLDKDFTPTNMSVNFVQHSRWNSYVDHSIQREMAAQLHHDAAATGKNSEFSEVPSVTDPSALEMEKKHLASEKSTDDKAFQRYRNFQRVRKNQ